MFTPVPELMFTPSPRCMFTTGPGFKFKAFDLEMWAEFEPEGLDDRKVLAFDL